MSGASGHSGWQRLQQYRVDNQHSYQQLQTGLEHYVSVFFMHSASLQFPGKTSSETR